MTAYKKGVQEINNSIPIFDEIKIELIKPLLTKIINKEFTLDDSVVFKKQFHDLISPSFEIKKSEIYKNKNNLLVFHFSATTLVKPFFDILFSFSIPFDSFNQDVSSDDIIFPLIKHSFIVEKNDPDSDKLSFTYYVFEDFFVFCDYSYNDELQPFFSIVDNVLNENDNLFKCLSVFPDFEALKIFDNNGNTNAIFSKKTNHNNINFLCEDIFGSEPEIFDDPCFLNNIEECKNIFYLNKKI